MPRPWALEILRRLNDPAASAVQREFVSTGPIGALQQELVRHAARAVKPAQLLGHLEQFERSDLITDARRLADDCRNLALSSAESYRQLGVAVEFHYRNANLRVAVTGDLLNRLMPQQSRVCRGA